MSKPIDHTGQTFGRLTVLGKAQKPEGSNNTFAHYLCKCSCGTVKVIAGDLLRRGNTKSCGCLLKERQNSKWRKTHGLSHTPEHAAWQQALTRCYNKNSKDYQGYGGRGIYMCDQWRNDFLSFYQDMGPRPSPQYSLDRIDNNGPYSAENCRWATPSEQRNNRGPVRHSKIAVLYKGETRTMASLARQFAIPEKTLRARLLRFGWDLESALTKPVQKKFNGNKNK